MEEAKKRPTIAIIGHSSAAVLLQAALLAQQEGVDVVNVEPGEDDFERLKAYCDADISGELLRVQHLQADRRMAQIEPYAGASELFGTRQERTRARTRKKTDRRFKL